MQRCIRTIAVAVPIAIALLSSCHLAADLDGDYQQLVPKGWEGPLTTNESALTPELCSEDAQEIAVLHSQLVSPPPSDVCACRVPPSPCRISVFPMNTNVAQCNALGIFEELPSDECIDINFNNRFVRSLAGELNVTACQSAEKSETTPQWGLHTRLCRSNVGRCIRHPGAVSCPAGPFDQRRLLYQNYSDTRVCDCGAVVGECNGTVVFFDEPNDGRKLEDDEHCRIEDNVGALSQSNHCLGPITANKVMYRHFAPDLSCSVDAPNALSGTVTPEQPFTLCCAP